MTHYRLSTLAAAAALITACAPTPARAVLLFGGDGSPNLSAPTGQYANSGYDNAAFYLNYNIDPNVCTWPISPTWAIRAQHTVQEGTGSILQDGIPHTIVRTVNLPGTDLALSEVDTPFPRYSQMYQGVAAPGSEEMIFGHGFQNKGAPIYTPGTTDHLAGWTFANTYNQYGWGRNLLQETTNVQIGSSVTNCLYSTFNAPTLDDGTPNPQFLGNDEATAAFGDSSGGVFIKQDGVWKLAGCIYAIDAGVYTEPNGTTPWTGAIFDARGMYADFPVDPNNPNGPTSRQVVGGANTINDLPGSSAYSLGFYATSMNTYSGFINDTISRGSGVVVAPEAGTLALTAGAAWASAAALLIRRRRFAR